MPHALALAKIALMDYPTAPVRWHSAGGNIERHNSLAWRLERREVKTTSLPMTGITDEEPEKEQGGTRRRNSFDIQVGSKTYQVGVGSVTGKLLENKREGKYPD